MSRPGTVHTIFGHFDQARLDRLRETIKGEEPDTDLKFEGADLNVKFGQYLAEHVETELSKRNAGL